MKAPTTDGAAQQREYAGKSRSGRSLPVPAARKTQTVITEATRHGAPTPPTHAHCARPRHLRITGRAHDASHAPILQVRKQRLGNRSEDVGGRAGLGRWACPSRSQLLTAPAEQEASAWTAAGRPGAPTREEAQSPTRLPFVHMLPIPTQSVQEKPRSVGLA